jgi:acetyl-CoA synthetase
MESPESKAQQAASAWMQFVDRMRERRVEFATALSHWNATLEGNAPPWPMWFPTAREQRDSNIARFCQQVGVTDFPALYHWSLADRSAFWTAVVAALRIRFQTPPTQTLNLDEGVESPRWLEGACWNIVESCFGAGENAPAVIYGDSAGRITTVSLGQLHRDMLRVADSLKRAGMRPGDAVAVMMPMNYESVMIYLGIIAAGCAAVSIADSFAAPEIRKRLEIADAKAIICQRSFLRAGKEVDIWSRVAEALQPMANGVRAIVIGDRVELRDTDVSWDEFLAGALDETRSGVVHRGSMETINILFSSGTTGDPKAIPWNQTTPIKCASDGYFHHDIQPGDVVAWPTNLGWMMGPWLIFAALINRATIALFDDAPVGEAFGRFVQNARVTMLGVVPTLVRTWRTSRSMENCDWSAIRCFSSTGEASNPEDMFYLSWLAGFKPVIEYCGGTEIGGGYISSTFVQPNVPGAFSTPAVGNQLLISAQREEECSTGMQVADADEGSLYLVPPALGLSTTLLNRDHRATYYEGLPTGPRGETLRRHGDHFRRVSGDFGTFYYAGGRIDDTMNLGGIKISSAEIEKVLNAIDAVRETAAIAVPPAGGGPDQLVVFTVLSDNRQPSDDASTALVTEMNRAIRAELNPLFKVAHVVVTDALPRTASNKVMRRKLRDRYRRHLLSS